MTATFDTLEYLETLKAAGISEKQAKAHVKALSNITNNTLATKRDLSDMENRMTIRLGGMFVVAVGVILAGMKYL